MKKNYTFAWNETSNQWLAQLRKPNDQGWKSIRVPKNLNLTKFNSIEAERYVIAAFNDLHSSNPIAKDKNLPPLTIAFLAEYWLKLRSTDMTTKPLSLRTFRSVLNSQVLNSSIANQDIFTLDRKFILEWIHKLPEADSYRISIIRTVKVLIDDLMVSGEPLEKLPMNPFQHKEIAKYRKTMQKNKDLKKKLDPVTHLTPEQIITLLTEPSKRVPDYRRIKYLLLLATGLRPAELAGLSWKHIHLDAAIPYLEVKQQLFFRGTLPVLFVEDLMKKFPDTFQEVMQKETCAIMQAPKYDSFRKIPLHPLLTAALKYWKKTGWKKHCGFAPTLEHPVFGVGGKQTIQLKRTECNGDFAFSDDALNFRRDLASVKLPLRSVGLPLVMHSLRHSVSTMLANIGGFHDSKIGQYLGHKNESIVRKHYINDDLVQLLPMMKALPLGNKLTLNDGTIIIPEEKI